MYDEFFATVLANARNQYLLLSKSEINAGLWSDNLKMLKLLDGFEVNKT